MRKIFSLVMSLMIISALSFGQTAKQTGKPVKATTATAKTEAKNTDKKAVKTKKDGTPDMRYKANKDAAKTAQPAGPMKKDGTPDKRYKANKTTPAATTKK